MDKELSEETVNRIEEEAEAYADSNERPGYAHYNGLLKGYKEAAKKYVIELQERDKEIERAHKYCNHLEENWTCKKSVDKINELTTERDAYKEALNDIDFVLMQLEDYLHGNEGTAITLLRGKIQSVLQKFNNNGA